MSIKTIKKLYLKRNLSTEYKGKFQNPFKLMLVYNNLIYVFR